MKSRQDVESNRHVKALIELNVGGTYTFKCPSGSGFDEVNRIRTQLSRERSWRKRNGQKVPRFRLEKHIMSDVKRGKDVVTMRKVITRLNLFEDRFDEFFTPEVVAEIEEEEEAARARRQARSQIIRLADYRRPPWCREQGR